MRINNKLELRKDHQMPLVVRQIKSAGKFKRNILMILSNKLINIAAEWSNIYIKGFTSIDYRQKCSSRVRIVDLQ